MDAGGQSQADRKPMGRLSGILITCLWLVGTLSVIAPDAVHADTDEFMGPPEPTVASADIIGTNDAPALFATNRLNRWHREWSSNVVGVAEYIDRFFGEQRIDVEANETRVKLSLGVQFREEDSPKGITKASIKLQLPRTSKRLKLIFEDLADTDDPFTDVQSLTESGQDNAVAGLRYSVKKKKWVSIDADLGVKLSSPVQAYTRLRARRNFDLSKKWSLRITEKLTWYTDDGWVSLSEVQWNRRMGWDWLLRFNTELEWREDRDGVRPAQQISLFKTVNRVRAFRIDVGGSWPEYPNIEDRKYFAAFTHRRLIHSNWLFLELKPGVEFPEEDDYDEQFYFKIQFDLLLGDVD